MRANNPFDKMLEAGKGQIPTDVLDAAVFVTDTMDLCIASAKAVFETQYSTELALEMYDRVVERMYMDKNNKNSEQE